MRSAIHNVTVDCRDPYDLARFWSQVVDRPMHDDDHPGDPEAVVLLGANGAGKTTALRAISGMIPSRGEITLDGQPVRGLRPEQLVRRGIAHVPQGRGTLGALSVEDTLRVVEDEPIIGVGIGGQPRASRELAGSDQPTPNFVSPPTPLHVVADLGVIGLALLLEPALAVDGGPAAVAGGAIISSVLASILGLTSSDVRDI